MSIRKFWFCCYLVLLPRIIHAQAPDVATKSSQYVTVLGIAQDGGYPQAGCTAEHCLRHWRGEEKKRQVVSLGLTDQASGQNWLFEATPDFTAQLQQLQQASGSSNLSGIFLTHAHMGHYAGLMFLGREAMNSKAVPVYAMPKMKSFLENNGPWSQLVTLNNIQIKPLTEGNWENISPSLRVKPILVPHRDEFSETVGFIIEGPHKKLLFIPDIDKWEKWQTDILSLVKEVDHALIDGTFFSAAEVRNRNIAEIPHPLVEESMKLFDSMPAKEKEKIMFIHFNHTNPLLNEQSEEARLLKSKGFRIAKINLRIDL